MARPEPAWVPAPRNGVAASRVVAGAGGWGDVLGFLRARFPAVAAEWPARLARGDVLGANGQPLQAGSACPPGLLLWYWRSPPPELRVPFEIVLLHQDAHLLVVDKPHFLAVTPGGRHLHETVLLRLRRQLGLPSLVPLHRLDRETAGVLMLSLQPTSRDAYCRLLRCHLVHKVYEAIAPWRADLALPMVCRSRLQNADGAAFMQALSVPGPPNAETLVELIARLPATPDLAHDLAHYRLTPRTGRRHQLRVQLSQLGLPIVGDRIYPRLWPEPPAGSVPDYQQPLQLLARELAFVDPLSGAPRRFTSQRRLLLAVPAGQ